MTRHDFNQIAAVLEAAGLSEAAAAHRLIAEGADPVEALGLKCGPGQRKYVNEVRRHRRNELLCELATNFFGHVRARSLVAKEMSTRLSRYFNGRWQRDCNNAEPPTGVRGVDLYCFQILQQINNPLSWQAINDVLRRSTDHSPTTP